MSVVKESYQELLLHGKSLGDIVVLSQAWKKSHAFIRRHNWYADVLELDASTVGLEDQLVAWGTDVGQADFQPGALCLVPAPKNFRWEFKPLVTLPSFGVALSRPLKKSARVQKVVISGVPHPLPTPEKSLVSRSGRSGFGGVSFLRTFSTAC